ncbi:MAG: hypothetical protein ACXVEE_06730 [Polyangiales bacterium]
MRSSFLPFVVVVTACKSGSLPPAATPPYPQCAGYHVRVQKHDPEIEAAFTKGEGAAAKAVVTLSFKKTNDGVVYELEKVEPAGFVVDDGPPAHLGVEGSKVCFEWGADDHADDACFGALMKQRWCTEAQ